MRKIDDVLNMETVQETRTTSKAAGAAEVVLTIAGHPDVSRIGAEAVLSNLALGARQPVSRAEPDFSGPFLADVRYTGEPLPLASPRISRSPLLLWSEINGDLTIDLAETRTTVLVDGHPVEGRLRVPAAALEVGVVLELGTDVVLVAHTRRERRSDAPLGMVGETDGIRRLRAAIARLAPLREPVLIRGETGAGKELVARALHEQSTRARRSFVAVNLAAVPATLAASSLFGNVRGAFSGADKDRKGFFEQADGGTLFLDEVGDAADDVQSSLLRTLETGEIQPVGASRPVKVDVRLVAATDADLEASERDGRFRAPLKYRLAVHTVRLPPLRERRADVSLLLMHFLRQLAEGSPRAARLDSVDSGWLSGAVWARLVRHDWPGNVRQLRNVAAWMASRLADRAIDPADPELLLLLPGSTTRATTPPASSPTPSPVDSGHKRPSELSAAEVEAALVATEFRLGEAAERLGISRPALNRLVDGMPGLTRANELTREAIEAALARCGGDVDQVWRDLRVSRRGLALRMREIGMIED